MAIKRTDKSKLLSQLTLNLLELEGAMEAKAQEFSGPYGQTPSHWKVLTAAGSDHFTVPQIARRMGLSRQAVQKIANTLVDEGLANFIDNPDHKTSLILQLTKKGRKVDEAISRKYTEWSNRFSKSLDAAQLEVTARTLEELTERLHKENKPKSKKGKRRG